MVSSGSAAERGRVLAKPTPFAAMARELRLALSQGSGNRDNIHQGLIQDKTHNTTKGHKQQERVVEVLGRPHLRGRVPLW